VNMSVVQAFLIDSIDVTAYVYQSSLEINDSIDTEDKGTVELSTAVLNVLGVLKQNLSFELKRGETVATVRCFQGYVGKVEMGTNKIVVTVKGELTRIDRREINYTFNKDVDPEAGVISAIASTIMTDGDLTPRVVDSGAVDVLNEFKCQRELRSRKLIELKNLLRWNCYHDHVTGQSVFEPQGYTSTGAVVTVGEYPLINSPSWTTNDDDLYNTFTVEGMESQVGKVEWFNGDGTTDTFTLSEFPLSINSVFSGSANYQTTVPTSVALMKGGAQGVTTDADFYFIEGDKDIEFVSTSIPIAGTNNVMVSYKYSESVPGYFVDEESVNDYGSREKTVSVLYVKTIEDVEKVGMSLLSEYAQPKLSTTIHLLNDLTVFPNSVNIIPNRTITVIDTQNPVPQNNTFPIRKVTLKYPDPYDIVEIGDYSVELADFLERTVDRIKKLEDRQKTQSTMSQYRFFDRTVEFPVRLDVYSASKEADTLYWEDLDQGDWDDFDWGDGTMETETLIRRVHQVGDWCDFDLYDQDLVDTSATTATVTTATGTVSFTTGQVFQTEKLFLNDQAYANILFELRNATVTVNLVWSASADGDTETWQTITPGTLHAFTTSTTGGVKLRAVASGTASVIFKDTAKDITTPAKITVT
jgi:hypothetical protein